PHPTHPPTIELEYPNANASESFVLLQPKDKDHYNPIFDLEKTLYTIVKYYLTPEQQEPFGPIPDESLSELADRDDDAPNDDSSSDTDSLPPSGRSGPSLLRSVQRAIHMHDGPLFVETMQTVNNILRDVKYPVLPDDLIDNPADLPRHTPYKWTDLPKDVLMRVLEENYQRCVGPHVPTLKKYEAFSSTVYGELMPSLSYEIVRLTKLHQDSLFLDLGSGVGQVVVQAALQSGCMGVGVEISEQPAEIAARMRTQFLTRCRMWGLNVGEIEFEHNDMLTSARIDELLPEADVVLVDNKVFAETLNEALRPKFLDLKEGALVVSLKPFVSALNARVTERNVDDISTIFDVTEHRYGSGSVSWGPSGGTYYIHRVDREGYAHIREKFEISRSSSRTSQR
ncbi:DOT1-domain-containing protein, partial [Fistulina hepatica ATCC 64428]